MRVSALLLLPLALSGCARSAAVPNPSSASPEAAVLAAEDRWYAALVARDTVALGLLLAPEFVLSGSSAELETRAQYLQTAQMPERTLRPIELEDRRVRIYGQAAVATGRATLRGEWRGRPISLDFRFTNIYVLHEGRWQAVASQISAVS